MNRFFFPLALALLAATASTARAGLTLSGGGLVIAEQGGTFAINNLAGATTAGAIPFASSELAPEIAPGFPFHRAININDEIHGNSNSWIGGSADAAPFAGVALDAPATLQSFAFGRDALGAFGDRALGLYTLQYTTVGGPSAATPAASWTTIGTLDYGVPAGGHYTAPALRHRYNFDPVSGVTGVRLITPAGAAVDELELYADAGAIQPLPPNIVITPAAGHSIGFDGNNGEHFTTASPALVPDNAAHVSRGAIAISSGDLGGSAELPGHPYHRVSNINDGLYGNRNSWIGEAGDAPPFAGVNLDGLYNVTSVAWGRDNGNTVADDCGGGTCMDRTAGVYTLQYTQVAAPDGSESVTGDPATGWTTIGTIDYQLSDPGVFDQYLRHEFDVTANGSPILANGIRLIMPGSGIGPGGTAIDELEVYGSPIPEPSTVVLAALGLVGVVLARRRR